MRGARLAALGLITGGLTAIPALTLISGASTWEHLLAVFVLALGVACLGIPQGRKGEYALYLVAVIATVVTTVATVLSSPAFALNYVFIALVMAVTMSFRFVMAGNGLISIGLLAPALLGPNAGADMLALPIIGGPALVVISAVAYQLTRMLEQSRQVFRQLSREDELTGVGNYRALLEKLDQEISRHSRHGQELALMVLDVNRFKLINDSHGHLYGDHVLTEIADAIYRSVRREDSIFRQGGDEFAVIAPHTNRVQLDPVIDRLHEKVAECGDGEIGITVSTGVAAFPADHTDPMDLLAAADERLMRVKRDRVENLGR